MRHRVVWAGNVYYYGLYTPDELEERGVCVQRELWGLHGTYMGYVVRKCGSAKFRDDPGFVSGTNDIVMHLSNPDRVESFLEEILPTTRLSYSEAEDGRLVIDINAPGSHVGIRSGQGYVHAAERWAAVAHSTLDISAPFAPIPPIIHGGVVAVGRHRIASIEVDPRRWPAPTRREFYAHLEAHGLDRKTPDPIGALRKAELVRGRTLDPRVSSVQLDELLALSADAAQLAPMRQNIFFGFSRLIDAKFDCTPAVLQGLIDRALEDPRLSAEELSHMLEQGPGEGDLIWSKPETPGQLVASLIRQPAQDAATSVPLNMSHDIARWLQDALASIGKPLHLAMGGAAAFGANLAAVMNELAPGRPLGVDFYAWDDHAPEIGALFGSGVNMLDRSGEQCLPSARASSDQSPRRNYIAAFPPKKPFALSIGDRTLRIDQVANGGRFVLSTPATQTTTFGDVSAEALETMAKKHDSFFFSGLHYLSADLPGAAMFRRQLDAIRSTNPKAQAHFEYAKAKAPEREHALMQALAGGLYSMSMNPGSELIGLLHRLSEEGLTDRRWPKDISSEDAETPAIMLEAAAQLMKTMRLSRLHFHAMTGDLLVIDGARDPRRQVLSLLRARQFVTMKAANRTGEIRMAHGRHRDVWPIHATFPGEYLAAEHAFADAMQERFGLSSDARDQIVRDRFYRDPETERLYVFVPSRGMRDKHGGTISAGDTIDLVAFLLGREEPGDSAEKRTRRLI